MLQAAAVAAEMGLCRPVVLGHRSDILTTARELGLDLSAVELLDMNDEALRQEMRDGFRRDTGTTAASGADLLPNRAYVGAMLVRSGWFDAAIGGARTSSADMLRAGISCLGLAEGRRTVSGAVFVDTQRPEVGSEGTLAFADAVVTPMPTTEQLVDIAAATAKSWRSLMTTEPRIAFLSFSTKGSSGSPHVDRVRAAFRLFQQQFPDEVADGELQFDAAVSSAVAARKSATGGVAGSANILIFPSLDSANIAYKVAEQLGGAQARAFLQGLARPFADVSRGCSADDIVTTVGMLMFDMLQGREFKHRFQSEEMR